MSEYDAEMYESFSSRVRRQVQSLRVILDSLQARGKERVWLRNQTSGELDDGKLIEGLTGERAIYKKRGEEDPEVRTAVIFARESAFHRYHVICVSIDHFLDLTCPLPWAPEEFFSKVRENAALARCEAPRLSLIHI